MFGLTPFFLTHLSVWFSSSCNGNLSGTSGWVLLLIGDHCLQKIFWLNPCKPFFLLTKPLPVYCVWPSMPASNSDSILTAWQLCSRRLTLTKCLAAIAGCIHRVWVFVAAAISCLNSLVYKVLGMFNICLILVCGNVGHNAPHSLVEFVSMMMSK